MANDRTRAPLSPQNCGLGELRQNTTFKRFVQCLNEQLDDYRAEYEDQEASEFNRGKVYALKELINSIAQQNIK